MPTDLSTLLAELDAKVEKMTPGPWFVSGPFPNASIYEGRINDYDRYDPDSGQLPPKWIAQGAYRCAKNIAEDHDMEGVVALVNAYPQLREALCSLTAWKAEALEVEKQWDVQAVGRAIGAPLGADIRSLILPAITALRTLLEQRTEALRDISEHLPCDLPCKMKPAQGKCGECGAYRFETWCAGCTARAVLAAEVPRESGE